MFGSMPKFKPMLAFTLEEGDQLTFPLLVSPKLDGIRMIIGEDGVPRTRSLKQIPNRFLRDRFTSLHLAGFDGEIIVGDPTAADVYRATNSAVMSEDGEPDGIFYVFDLVDPPKPYGERLGAVQFLDQHRGLPSYVKVVDHQMVHDITELYAVEDRFLGQGYEGVMLRDPIGRYKFGRATKRSGELGKLKRFRDDEAVIVDFEERMHNGNEATKDELGRTKRSSHQENLTGLNTLGALYVEHATFGVFKIGSGFSAAEAQKLWDNRSALHGQSVKFKYFPIGVKDKPRHPVYLGVRSDL